jgi:hypothetical protein
MYFSSVSPKQLCGANVWLNVRSPPPSPRTHRQEEKKENPHCLLSLDLCFGFLSQTLFSYLVPMV